MTCATTYRTCLIRGDIWALDVGLGPEWVEVDEDPGGYVGKIVFREDQDDSLTPKLVLQTVPQRVVDPTPGSPKLFMEFTATAGETQQLPDYGLVGYCEIAPIASPDQSRRLFNMKVEIND